MNEQQKVAIGSIMGALIGDAAGATLEFQFSQREVDKNSLQQALSFMGGGVFHLAPAQITDDGEMTLSGLKSLAQHHGIYIPDIVAQGYLNWVASRPFDMGLTTTTALYVPKGYREIDGLAKQIQNRAAQFNLASKANGSLMRATPLGVAGALTSMEDTIQLVRQDVLMTHPNPVCVDATIAYVLAVRQLILQPRNHTSALDVALSYLHVGNQEVRSWLDQVIAGQLPKAYPQEGYIQKAFSYAFYHLLQNTPFEKALQDTLQKGGDTDTNACIVGGLIGALWGIDGINTNWVEKLLACDTKQGAHSRPEQYHPKNIKAWLHFLK